MEIYDLRTEGMREPLGIDAACPAFSWKIKGEGTFQKNYRVTVATSLQSLHSEEPDLWDSGVVESAETLFVRYGGKPLDECKQYFWKVTVNGESSAEASFETAYLGKAMPKAIWIGMPFAYHGSADVVRLDFCPKGKLKRARLYLAALGCPRIYLNGEPVSDGYFDGAISVYSKRVFYRTFALSPKEGKNALCVELGYGFYGAKKCKAELRLEYEDGETETFPTVAGRVWNVTHGAVKENSVYGGEVYDGRIPTDIYLPAYPPTTSRFVSAYCTDSPSGELRACIIPPVRVAESFAPVSLIKKRGRVIIDAGKNICGWLRIKVRGKRGAKISIRYAELLDQNGELNRNNLRSADCRDLYILAGAGEEVYAPSFTYHGFRYGEITCEGKAKILSVNVERIRSDLESGGEFYTSDKSLQRLHDMAKLTEANNLNGVFTDCPQRDERLGWLNDMSSRAFEAVCNFDLRCFLPNFVDMITDSQDESGAFGDTVPFTVGSSVADSVDAYPVLGWLAYRFYGDIGVLERNYEGFCKWNKRLSEFEKDGVMEWEIYGDWCPAFPFSKGGDGTHTAQVAENFMGAASYIWNVKLTSQIAALLKKADADFWQSEYVRLKEAFFKRYLDGDKLGNGSQSEYAMALTVFSEEKEAGAIWAKRAAEDIVSRGYHTTCGNLGYRHLFYRLSEAGYSDTLYRLLTNPEYPGWGYMLKSGATTVWERWEADVSTDMHSFNHPMFAAYDGFLYHYVAGIRAEECQNAFSEIVIEPCFIEGLNDAEAVLHTVRGDVRSKWKREGEHILLEISTPANTRLTVRARGKKLVFKEKEYNGELNVTNGNFSIVIKEEA